MTLVSYSDSEFESDCSMPSPIVSKKRKRNDNIEQPNKKLPPLPQKFHSLYATSTRTYPSDDSSIHDGRTRQVPHIEGNWPTHIYLEWYPPRNELQVMENIISAANTDNQIHSLLHSELGAQLPLHISLSAPLVLKTEQKSEYEEAVEEAIKSSRVPSFETTIRGVRWQRNFDGTRYFLVLRISKAMMDDELNRLLNCCNACAKQFNLPLLYDYDTATANPGTRPAASNSTSANHDSSGTSPNHDTWRTPVDRTDAFHISIAWQLAAPTLKHKVVIAHPGIEKLKKVVQVERTLGFKVVKLKIGNMVKDIPLRKPT